jgi:hypothetical protein
MIPILMVLVLVARCGASPTAFGAYEPNRRAMYQDLAPVYFRDLVKHGFDTSTVSGNANLTFGPTQAIGLARQIDLMVEAGLLKRKDVPMLVLSCDPRDIVDSRQYAAHPQSWPELVCGNVDEPNPLKIRSVRENSCESRNRGLRSGTAISGHDLFRMHETWDTDGSLAGWLDVWWVLASTWHKSLPQEAHEETADLCAYWSYPREPDRDRYLVELWCLKHNPKVFYFWAYHHSAGGYLPNGKFYFPDKDDTFTMAWPRADGTTETTLAFEAIREGIRDYHLLYELQQSGKGGKWLEDLIASVPCHMSVPPKPVPDHPPFDEISKRARRLLES